MAMVTIFPFFIFHFPNFSALPLSLNANESKNENEKTYGTYLKSNQMMCNNFNIIRMRIDHSKTLSWPLVSLLWLLSWGQQIMLSVRLPRYSEFAIPISFRTSKENVRGTDIKKLEPPDVLQNPYPGDPHQNYHYNHHFTLPA